MQKHHLHVLKIHHMVILSLTSIAGSWLLFGTRLLCGTHLPLPDADGPVVLVPHRYDIAPVGGESYTRHPVLMTLDLSHLRPLCHVPYSHTGHVPALPSNKESKRNE